MRIVYLIDIHNKEVSDTSEDTSEFIHGGMFSWKNIVEEANRHDMKAELYYSGMKFQKDDIVLMIDRSLGAFVKSWKMLKNAGMLNRTLAYMVESDVVDRKCACKIMTGIKNCFGAILTYQDDVIDNRKFYKIWPTINIPNEIAPKLRSFDELNLTTMIATKQIISEMPGEFYSERIRIAEWFEEHPEYGFKVFGRRWDGLSVNGGMIKDKSEAYGNAKFAFCIENSRRNGYITEKIFDCFAEGIVPIYSGAPNVTEYIPGDCFIDYSAFNSTEEIVKYLSEISEEEYNNYLLNIKKFLSSGTDKFTYNGLWDAIEYINENNCDKKYGVIDELKMWWYVAKHENQILRKNQRKRYIRMIKQKLHME